MRCTFRRALGEDKPCVFAEFALFERCRGNVFRAEPSPHGKAPPLFCYASNHWASGKRPRTMQAHTDSPSRCVGAHKETGEESFAELQRRRSYLRRERHTEGRRFLHPSVFDAQVRLAGCRKRDGSEKERP